MTRAFLGTILALALSLPAAEASQFMAGAAHRVVTPAVGHLLAGYGRDRAATGVHDDLFARAVVIGDNTNRIALVTIDSIGLTRPDILVIRRMIEARIPQLPAANVLISSTHSHAGPDVVGLWGTSLLSSGRDSSYMQSLYEAVTAAVDEANDRMVPVTSRVASGQAPLAWVENRSEPELLDRTMAVLQFMDLNGSTVATLTNFACHPTVLDGDNTLLSSDYVGGFYTAMSEALTGEHLFLQGAIGGWVQPLLTDHHTTMSTSGLLQQLGAQVASASLQLIADAQENPWQPIVLRTESFDVELENWGFWLMIRIGILERDLFDGAMRTEAAWLQLGQAQLVTHPGETSPAFSLASRALMDAQHTFVLGLTQDAMGYILKPDYFAEDAPYPHASYLTSVSAGPTAGPELMRALRKLIGARPNQGEPGT